MTTRPNTAIQRTAAALLLLACIAYSQPIILVNEVGYEKEGPKRAVIQSSDPLASQTCYIINEQNSIVDSTTPGEEITVEGWKNRRFRVADFSSFKTDGNYKLKYGQVTSPLFSIGQNVLLNKTGADQIGFFNGMRNTDQDDKAVALFGGSGTRNAYGGWNDATGDRGKYLSHLSFANFFNPQQIPMVVWAIVHAIEMKPDFFATEAKAEAAWGADYLLRALDPAGFFYLTIFDNWGYNFPREICAWSHSEGVRSGDYQAAMREGAGMSIAALARASKAGISGDSSSASYLNGAKRAYAHLKANPTKYQDDKKENIIDDYCGLMAAVELYNATSEAEYLSDAQARVSSLLARQSEEGWFYSSNDAQGNNSRPFYHAAEEGLPVVALSRYAQLVNPTDIQVIRDAIKKNLLWYKNITLNDPNPFHYAKMYRAVSAGSVAGSDLARNRPVTSSGVENDNINFGAEKAVDGSSTTRWSSDFGNDKWISVDLGSVYKVNRVLLRWEAAYGKAYRIEVSLNGTSWTKAAEVTDGTAGLRELTFSPVQGQYVRMYGVERGMECCGFSLYDFEVYGEETNTPSPYQSTFFMPQQNETGYWWQGENARLSSMAAAFILGSPLADPTGDLWKNTFYDLAVSQLDWILGKNPFATCLMFGYGVKNYENYPGLGGYAFPNVKGGICNGITAMRADQKDLEFMPYHQRAADSLWADWRWMEQWLPHNAWYLTAMSSLAYRIDNPIIAPIAIQVPPRSSSRSELKSIRTLGNTLNLTLSSAAKARTEVALFSIKGQKIMSFVVDKGKNSAMVHIPNSVSSGMYLLQIKNGKWISDHQFNIMR